MKKECTEMEIVMRFSLVDDAARQMRARELAVGASTYMLDDVERITTEGVAIDADTSHGVPTNDRASTGKSNPSTF